MFDLPQTMPIATPEPGVSPETAPCQALTVQVDKVDESQWNALLPRFADVNIYQTWAYGAVHWGESQLSHLVLYRHHEPVAAAQLRIVRIPLLNRGIAYLRWGPCCQRRGGPWDAGIWGSMLDALVAEYAYRRRYLLRIIPNIYDNDPHAESALAALTERGFQPESGASVYRTIRVDLTPEPAVIRKRLDQKWRNQLNGAERNGLTVLEDAGDSLYAQFIALYNEMMGRKQFDTTVDVHEFRRVQRRLPDAAKMVIMICVKDSVPLAGLIGAPLGETGIYLLGATSNEGMKSKGSYLLQWQMMNRLKERGCRWYDLGGINPDTNPGVYHFKRGFGGQAVSLLGRFEVRDNWLSYHCVRAAEKLRTLLRPPKLRSELRPAPAQQPSLPAAVS